VGKHEVVVVRAQEVMLGLGVMDMMDVVGRVLGG
jgi:hypothetical protein